jgi:tetratricopeptide (TPR) repeat protein
LRTFLNDIMVSIAESMEVAAGSFQRISDATTGERRRRANAVALVLRVVAQAGDRGACWFLRRRAGVEVGAMRKGGERGALLRLLDRVDDSTFTPREVSDCLISLAGELERTHRLPEADAALSLAAELSPRCAEVALHAGRVARKSGDVERAVEMYLRARKLDGGEGSLGRLAAVGEAAVSDDPERALGTVMRVALRRGDVEAAAVAQEERARCRRAAGRQGAAIRDLCVAAARFPDAIDRARVAHELADLASARGDLATIREALLLALSCGDVPQRDHARARLHTLCRGQGDQLGMRRWRSNGPPALVSLTPLRAASGRPSPAAGILRRFRESVAD